jgi:protein TonB
VSARRGAKKIASALLVVVVLAVSAGVVRSAHAAEDPGDRKVKYRVEPQYPEIARKLGLSGVVKLEVVVAPNGSVKETKVIGGHPILVNAAVDAVKKWKFESANAESTKPLEFKFQPD